MTEGRTREVLEGLAQPLRRRSITGWAVALLAVASLAFGAGAWGLRSDLFRPGAGVLLVWAGVVLAAPVLGALAWRERHRLAVAKLAELLETTGATRRGALSAVLDVPASGTSPDLAVAADAAAARLVPVAAANALAPLSGRLKRRSAAVTVGLVAGLAALASAGPSHPRVVPLWSPGMALDHLFAPVRLAASRTVVDRGGSVSLRLEAVGQRSATLWRRAPGQPWSATTMLLDSLGRADLAVSPVESDLYFRLSAGRRSSDTLAVRVRVPAFLGVLSLRARYPKYLDLEDEPLAVSGDTLLLPAGTTLESEGEASTALSTAAWEAAGRSVPLVTEGRRFSGQFTPVASGSYSLRLQPADGAALAGDPVVLPLVLVPDQPPHVEIPVPGADTVAPLDLRVPLVLDAGDDHGLTRVELVSQIGRTGSAATRDVPLPAGGGDRALLQIILDLSTLGLEAGDTVRYHARAIDNSPRGQAGRSREFVVLVPSAADQRQARREATADARQRLDSLVAASRRLERQTEDLASERQRAGDAARDPALGFEEARRSEAVARSQEALLREAEELQQTLEALKDAAERGESPDSALARRLEEISAQLDKALSAELRERLAALQQALKDLDPEATREALQQLAGVQEALREALERSRELFKRAALEGELGTLADDAADLAKAQQEWNSQVGRSDSTSAAAAEETLAERTDSLASGLDQVSGQLESPAARQQLAQAASQARQAAQQMRSAAGAASQGQRQEARSRGQQAQAQMEQVSREAGEQRQQQQDAWRQEVLDALDRAMAETAQLSRQQLAVFEAFRRGADVPGARREQALVEESAQKLITQVAAVSGKNALVPPQIAVALAVARRQMGLARDAVSTASPNLREAAESAGEAVDALAVAVYQMIRAKDDVAGSSSGSGLAEAMERMTQMAQQQGQLSQQAGSLLPMMGAAGMQQQLQSLAAQQRALAQQMERMRAQGQVPGSRELSAEARELAARLEAGRLDRETVERQERLFRRMLDAGRTLEGEERDEQKERQSTTARPGELRLPPALRQRLGDETAPRFPTWEELQRLSPEERRLVTEYFRRIAAGALP
ncbi:MAG: hypothetical protein OEW44_03760 [Gemmatimonadota bacterium]|jgi:hypothetical protein|nr:hypothetical protein [Gemmatimonadota bacterium]